MIYIDEEGNVIENPDWSIWQTVGMEEIYDGDTKEIVMHVRKYSEYELKERSIIESRSGLQTTDYISAKVLDSLLSCENITDILRVLATFKSEYKEVIQKRKEWRDKINELEVE